MASYKTQNFAAKSACGQITGAITLSLVRHRILLCVFRISHIASDFTRIAKSHLLYIALDAFLSYKIRDWPVKRA